MPREIRVLIVEDNPADIALMVDTLQEYGFDVRWNSVDNERDYLTELRSAPEVILCDYVLPGFGGLYALEILKTAQSPIPLIIVSGQIGEETAVAAMQAGAADYLLKDRLGRLGPAVCRALEQSELREQARRTAARLEEQKQAFNQVLDTAYDAFMTVTPAGQIIKWNTRAEEMFGWKKSEVIGQLMVNIVVPPFGQKRCSEGLNHVFKDPKHPFFSHPRELTGLHRSGREFPAEVTFWPTVEGVSRTVNAFIRDLTDRNRALAELRASEARFRTMFEIASVGIGQADPRNGRLLVVNDKMCEITGYPREELLNLHVKQLTHPDDQQSDWALYQKAACGELPQYINEKRYVRKDGSIAWVRVNAAFIRDDAGEAVLTMTVIENISSRKRAEDLARQSQKMDAIGKLAGGVAHDFNNMLTVISGFSELSLRRIADNDPIRSMITEIHSTAARAAALTRKLLTFSRRQFTVPVLVDLNSLLNDMSTMLTRIIGEDIVCSMRLAPQLWPVLVDPLQFEQVVLNLATNARDAMPDGGKLTIETLNVVVDQHYGEQYLGATPGDYVLMSVNDQGHGIEQSVLPYIFEPFFTTKAGDKGTGLGLAIVHGVVTQTGGRIEVDSLPNAGTTFRIFIPGQRHGLVNEVSAQPVERPMEGDETVLLVEDDASVRAFARIVLQSHGYIVIEADHGKEALQMFLSSHNDVDLLITDIVMPNMGGRQLSESLIAEKPDIRVLYLSGYADDTMIQQGMLGEQMAFLQKPFSVYALLSSVREVLDRQLQ